MNSKLLPLTLAIASALLIIPRTAHAISYTFIVEVSSGIGVGTFTIDLPDAWPGNIGQSTIIPATSFQVSLAGGGRCTSVAISLNETLVHHDNALIFGALKMVPYFM